MPGALGHGQEPFPPPPPWGGARHQEVGPPPSSPSGKKQNRWADAPARFRRGKEEAAAEAAAFNESPQAPGGRGSFQGRWMRVAGPAPGGSLPCTGQPPASPPALLQHRRVSAGEGGPGHLPTLPDGAAHSVRVWNWSAASLGNLGGQAGGQGQPGVGVGSSLGDTGKGGTLTRAQGKTGCGPRSGWLPGPAAQTHSGRRPPTGSGGLCAGHRGSWAPRGGACRALWGLQSALLPHCPSRCPAPHLGRRAGAGRRRRGAPPSP